jgi:type I restriction enzyme, S subunit
MSDLPEGWANTALRELVSPRGEKALPRELGDARFIGMDHIEAHTSRLLDTQPVSEFKSAVSVFKKGDILYGRLRPYLNKVYEADFDGAASAEFIVLPESPAIERRLLVLFLRDPRFVEFASRRSTGDRPRVKFESISDYRISLPPRAEQHRIVARLNRLLERTRRAREELSHIPLLVENYKQAILAAAFRGDLTAHWRTRHGTPDHWPMGNIGAAISDIRYGTSKKCTPEAHGTAVLRIPNVTSDGIDTSDLKYTYLTPKELQKLSLQLGDLLVVRSNGSVDLVGRSVVVEDDAVGYAYAGYLIRLRPNRNIVDPDFLKWMLSCPQTRKTIEVNARSTSGVHNINSEELQALPLPLPTVTYRSDWV